MCFQQPSTAFLSGWRAFRGLLAVSFRNNGEKRQIQDQNFFACPFSIQLANIKVAAEDQIGTGHVVRMISEPSRRSGSTQIEFDDLHHQPDQPGKNDFRHLYVANHP